MLGLLRNDLISHARPRNRRVAALADLALYLRMVQRLLALEPAHRPVPQAAAQPAPDPDSPRMPRTG